MRRSGHVQVRVQAIDIAGRHAVFFSPDDLSEGMLSADYRMLLSYAPETATAIVRNMLLYAASK